VAITINLTTSVDVYGLEKGEALIERGPLSKGGNIWRCPRATETLFYLD